ncbi:MAG TPA: hypothetical protein VFE31_05770 [Opitutaceae bacterium]|jgi:hypothetical protein|nr:hypothetical protein [Opitutaceae bacterium]
MDDTFPQRRLPSHPSLEHLRKQAKQLAKRSALKLAVAQHRVAKEYGFAKWSDLARAVTASQLPKGSRESILCQRCGQKAATVHFTVVVFGRIRERHLCAECAATDEGAARDLVPITAAPVILRHAADGRLPHATIGPRAMRAAFTGRMPPDIRDITLRPNMTKEDVGAQLLFAKEHLGRGSKVRLRVKLGPEDLSRPGPGYILIGKAIEHLAEAGIPAADVVLERSHLVLLLKPRVH